MFKRRSITAVAVILTAVSCAPPAHADSAQDLAEKYGISVCRSLDADPTIDGVLNTGVSLTKKANIDPYVAGQVLAYSAIWFCPKHVALLKRFADYYKEGREA
ncbi:Bacteriophage protein [Mycobacteroides abscessus subsp. abscessus]|nr:Bacteriophage protein [Mycobacteroides abscessus subsp. abscessus]